MELDIALRAAGVKRWTIVPLLQAQSVAEHQYRAWLISLILVDKFTAAGGRLNQDDAALIHRGCLVHDLGEVLTGDIPTTMKELAESVSPGAIKKIEEAARTKMGLETEGVWKGTIAGHCIKICDVLETAHFAWRNGVDERVWAHVRSNYDAVINHALAQYPHDPWGIVVNGTIIAMEPDSIKWQAAMGAQ